MNAHIRQVMTDSAQDFRALVWPRIASTPLVNGGEIRPVELLTADQLPIPVDTLAGIDAWQVSHRQGFMRGIASRVQWGVCYSSFTIRTRSVFGQETELHKRWRALQHSADGYLYPHLTVQAYVDQRQGKLLAAAAIRTRCLIEAAIALTGTAGLLDKPNRAYGLRRNPDGSQFLFMTWAYLIELNAMEQDSLVVA